MANQKPPTKTNSTSRKAGAAAALMSVAVLLGTGGVAAAQLSPATVVGDTAVQQVTPEPPADDAPAPDGDEERPERDRRGHRRGQAHMVAAETIGITVDELRTEFKSGKSIAQIAEENGVEPQAVTDALIAALEVRLDTAVENGRLTEEQAAEKLAQKSERIAERVERVPGEGRPGAETNGETDADA